VVGQICLVYRILCSIKILYFKLTNKLQSDTTIRTPASHRCSFKNKHYVESKSGNSIWNFPIRIHHAYYYPKLNLSFILVLRWSM